MTVRPGKRKKRANQRRRLPTALTPAFGTTTVGMAGAMGPSRPLKTTHYHAGAVFPITSNTVLLSMRPTRRNQTMDLYKRVTVSLFGDPTRIARALGLDIELPDPDCEDPAYWERVHAKGWKPQLQGKIADPEFNDDPDWCSLLRLDFGEVRFDLEEGIKIMTQLHDLPRVMELVYRLGDAGIPLKDEDGKWLVHAMAAVFPTRPEFDTGMREAGLVQDPRRDFWWEPPPNRDMESPSWRK